MCKFISKHWKIILINISTFSLLIFSLFLLINLKSKESFYFSSFCILIFTLIYLRTILKIPISSKYINLDKEINELQITQKEIKELSNFIIKTFYLIFYGSKKFGGVPDSFIKKFESNTKSIAPFLDKNIKSIAKSEISKIQQNKQK